MVRNEFWLTIKKCLAILLVILFGTHFSLQAAQYQLPDEALLQRALASFASKEMDNLPVDPDQERLMQLTKNALKWMELRKKAIEEGKNYEEVIKQFPAKSGELRSELMAATQRRVEPRALNNAPSSVLSSLLVEMSEKLKEQDIAQQQEMERSQKIADALRHLPHRLSEARRLLLEAQERLAGTADNGEKQPHNLQKEQEFFIITSEKNAEVAARKAQLKTVELQKSFENKQLEISRLRIEVINQKIQLIAFEQRLLRDALTVVRNKETQRLAQEDNYLPQALVIVLQENRDLQEMLYKQAEAVDRILEEKAKISEKTNQMRQRESKIRKQARWLAASPALGKTLRAQMEKLPESPNLNLLDRNIAELSRKRLDHESQLEDIRYRMKAPSLKVEQFTQWTKPHKEKYCEQRERKAELLSELLEHYDRTVAELTELKIANTELVQALKDLKNVAHRYLFWVPDVNPISLEFPVEIARGLQGIVSSIDSALVAKLFKNVAHNQDASKITLLALGCLLTILSATSRSKYYMFLLRASSRIGKVTQDHFGLTLWTILWATWISASVPFLFWIIGSLLKTADQIPAIAALGGGLWSLAPFLWALLVCHSFFHRRGLFIEHFHWPVEQVQKARRYYSFALWLAVPLSIGVFACNELGTHFSVNLGRLMFMILCLALTVFSLKLQRIGILLYVDKKRSSENHPLNQALWGLLSVAPPAALFFCALGYFATATALLVRLELSIGIWFGFFTVYHTIRRWMLIQRRRIAFERAKQRRADILAQRARLEEELALGGDGLAQDIEDSEVNLDTISARSLQLVRSVIALVTLGCLIVLWSELHAAFAFLENIRLWDGRFIKGETEVYAVTLGAVFIALVVFLVTTQLVRNLPALLELAILQHLDLSPGTGYAITTLTKYTLTLAGGGIIFSLLGFDSAKLQWVITVFAAGIGFGLREIFASFVSGLIILFEKLIRIGDTITSGDYTGTVTKISTLSTTMVDWDRKEVIVPNKSLINDSFVNWTLSDSITRVILKVPAPMDIRADTIIRILEEIAFNTPQVLDAPTPEIYLLDVEQGLQLFELRVYVAEVAHRTPLRSELNQTILAAYRSHNITLPHLPIEARVEIVSRRRLKETAASVPSPA